MVPYGDPEAPLGGSHTGIGAAPHFANVLVVDGPRELAGFLRNRNAPAEVQQAEGLPCAGTADDDVVDHESELVGECLPHKVLEHGRVLHDFLGEVDQAGELRRFQMQVLRTSVCFW